MREFSALELDHSSSWVCNVPPKRTTDTQDIPTETQHTFCDGKLSCIMFSIQFSIHKNYERHQLRFPVNVSDVDSSSESLYFNMLGKLSSP